MFNLRVPLEARDEVFLMNTLTDAQLIVSSDVAALLDRVEKREVSGSTLDAEEREALDLLWENGFLVENRAADRHALDSYLDTVKSNTDELNVTVLTTLQCNFACDYCFQGDHGDYNKFADKMSPEMALRVCDWIERELDRVQPEKFVLTFFGGEPLLNIPVMYTIAERASAGLAGPRRRALHQHHHQRPAAVRRGRRSAAAARAERHQDHARWRPRHPQPDASATRRAGHLRSDRREHPQGRRPLPDRDRRQLR